MNKGISPGPVNGNTGNCIKEAVCIHTDKVYDSCRDKECLEDIRVYLTVADQEIIDHAVSIKATTAELIWEFVPDASMYSIAPTGCKCFHLTGFRTLPAKRQSWL